MDIFKITGCYALKNWIYKAKGDEKMTSNGVLLRGIKLNSDRVCSQSDVHAECTLGLLMVFKTWWLRNTYDFTEVKVCVSCQTV